MKVQHFLLYPSLDPKYGGPTYSVPIQCIGTQREGAEMSFVVYEASKPFEERLIAEGVKIIHLPNPENKYQHSWATNLKRYFNTNTDLPDILHFHGVWMPANLRVSKFGQKNYIPYVINPRGDTEVARINYNKLKKFKKMLAWHLYSKSIVDNAACIIATSEQEKESIRLLGSKVPVAIIPNGIELDAFPKEVVHNHGEKKILLFLSRVNPIKGIEYLIDAWSQLPESLRSEWELHIVGNSDPKKYIHTLEDKVKVLNLSKSIKFVGSITGEAKIRKYQDSNLFILPTLNENFGNVVAEAMMCECPVITTINAPWSCLEEDKCGWWIELSVESLLKVLIESMSMTDAERHELGKRSRQCIINRYSSQSVAKQTYKLYEWILGNCEKPDFVEIVK
ncbi:glycosyltransferase [Bacteroides sp. AN502(2024)]|uniref:glycosyltransferase n=1 Tax=Bacteroides sp. AN502(2024) TaxID=3160599 RepID=UPI0035187CE2